MLLRLKILVPYWSILQHETAQTRPVYLVPYHNANTYENT